MRPFVSKRETVHRIVRNVKSSRFKKTAKLRESIGVVQPKNYLRAAFLNVDGLNEVTFEDVSSTIVNQHQDVVFLVETKRREEEPGIDITIPGYSLLETRRSNLAKDKDGGGIAVYTKLGD